jgi:hypothetical protein
MTLGLRKLALTTHVTSSVGWLGAVVSFLALAVAGLVSQDAQTVRAAYLAMEVTTWFVIVPLAFASLLTGLVVSLGTPWGLFRHYWVLVKFVLTLLATALLLLHTQPIGVLARIARETALSSADVGRLQMQLVGDAGAALLALLVNATLSVYKPRGLTPYGRRKQREQRQACLAPSSSELGSDLHANGDARGEPRWIKVLAFVVIAVALIFVILHLAGRGLGSLHHHG